MRHFTVISFKEARDQIAVELGDHNIAFYGACDEVALTVRDGVSLTEKLVGDIIDDWLQWEEREQCAAEGRDWFEEYDEEADCDYVENPETKEVQVINYP